MNRTATRLAWGVGLLAALTAIVDFILELRILGYVVQAATWSWWLIVAVLTFAVPVWTLILGAVVLVVAVILVGSRGGAETPKRVPSWDRTDAYRADRIFDVDWTWTWAQWGVNNPVPLCPGCKNELDYYEIYPDHRLATRYAGLTSGHELGCSHCGRKTSAPTGNLDVDVKKEIRRRLRTGEWKGAEDRLAQPA